MGEKLRKRAFEGFELRPGDTVLDVGCGTGLSFPLIERAIGPSGRIIAIEPSPEMLALARARVEGAKWKNITFIHAAADKAVIPVRVDAIVIFRVHEVLRSRTALRNLFQRAKPQARVLSVGVKWAPWWALPLNLTIWTLTRGVTTTREGFSRPWDLLVEFADLSVRPVALGAHYIASGKIKSKQ
jgi:demethylmenaquinone methyltransferase/2-methoxy-6-polyprenyl-1,4-benzoquinol methylase